MERIFVTGGTGFFGKSILARRLRDGVEAARSRLTILSRDPDAFRAAEPALATQPGVEWVRGDVRDFDFASMRGDFDAVVHAATSAVTTLSDDEQTSVILDGARHVIDFARRMGVPRILFTSSGAVYGPQTAPVDEEAPCAPATAYGRAKLAAERLLLDSGLDVRIARCFAFTGPHLNRRIHFAIGNFIQDVLDGRPIVIQGDGTPLRSYLHADDLVAWLLAILERGVPGRPYNVGSDVAVSIRELAGIVRDALGGHNEIQVLGTPTGAPASVYVPRVDRARAELGLAVTLDLPTAIRRSVAH